MSTLNDMLETALWSTIGYNEDGSDYLTQDELNHSPIGHDLWLTIHGHGAGFWDGDYKNGEKLTELCKQFEKLGLEDELQGSLKW